MIEIQIKDQILYDKLKIYANYHSDLTHVCSFRDEMFDTLKEEGLDPSPVETKKEKPILDIQGKNVMKLINAPAEMLFFVGVRSEFDPTIPVRFMHEVALIVEQGLVTTTDKFDSLYSHLSYRSKINELVCSNIKFQSKGKLIDYIDGSLSIQSLKIKDCREKHIAYKQIELKVLEPIKEKEKYLELVCQEVKPLNTNAKTSQQIKPQRILLRFYNKYHKLLNSIAFIGNKFSISTNKISEFGGSLLIYDPYILPKGLDYRSDTMFTPPSRAIPIDLYRNALYEFMFRYNRDNGGSEE